MQKDLLHQMRQQSFILFVILLITAIPSFSQTTPPSGSGLASVNGIQVYYEIHGTGEPLILLHGAFMTNRMNWGQMIPELSKTRKVIALEMQGHGHSPYSDRAMSFPVLANDVAEVMKFLKIDSADVLGYSFGGTIAYQLAISHPKRVKKLIIISATYKSEGWQPEVRNAFQSLQPEFLDNTPLKTEYLQTASDTANWTKFISKMIGFIKGSFNLGDEKIKGIKGPVLLIMGDNDGIEKNVLFKTYQLLGGGVVGDMAVMPASQLAILPGKSHVTLMMDVPPVLAAVEGFLNPKPMMMGQ